MAEDHGSSSRHMSASQKELGDEDARVVRVGDAARTNERPVRTAKYSPLTFLPRNLFEQFHRLAYVYFLVIAEAFDAAAGSSPAAAPRIAAVWKAKRAPGLGSERCLREEIAVIHEAVMDLIHIRKKERGLPQVNAAGHDTTSSALSWFFWLLTRHPPSPACHRSIPRCSRPGRGRAWAARAQLPAAASGSPRLGGGEGRVARRWPPPSPAAVFALSGSTRARWQRRDRERRATMNVTQLPHGLQYQLDLQSSTAPPSRRQKGKKRRRRRLQSIHLPPTSRLLLSPPPALSSPPAAVALPQLAPTSSIPHESAARRTAMAALQAAPASSSLACAPGAAPLRSSFSTSWFVRLPAPARRRVATAARIAMQVASKQAYICRNCELYSTFVCSVSSTSRRGWVMLKRKKKWAHGEIEARVHMPTGVECLF